MATLTMLSKLGTALIGAGGIVWTTVEKGPIALKWLTTSAPLVRRRLAKKCSKEWVGVRLTPKTFVVNKKMQEAALADTNAFLGLMVMAAPEGAGKTTALAAAVKQLRNDDMSPVTGQLVFDLEDATSVRTALDAEFCGHSPVDVLPKGTVVVLDHLDDVATETVTDMGPTLRKLAHSALQSQHFTVVALCRDPVFAEDVVQLNNAEKIHRVRGVNEWRMTPTEIDELFTKSLEAHAGYGTWFRSEWQEAIRAAAHEARTPAFVVHAMRRVSEDRPPVELDLHVTSICASWAYFLSAAHRSWSIER